MTTGTHLLKVESGGHLWNCHVHVPPAYDSSVAMPLVLLLHGAGGGGRLYLDRALWARHSDAHGFIVAAPDGLPGNPGMLPDFVNNPRLWNSGQLRHFQARLEVDDVAFCKRLLVELNRRYSVDPARVFLAGHSNGGGLAFKLANEMPEYFAALATVGTVCWEANPHPSVPLPVLWMVGTADPLVPFAGGQVMLPWGASRQSPSVMASMARWAAALGCPAAPRVLRDDTTAQIMDYGPGRDGVKMTGWVLPGQGHNWPGGKPLLPEELMGPNLSTVNATEVIWNFFRQHQRRN
jgi:polyhydroxybutyrate depolymerase